MAGLTNRGVFAALQIGVTLFAAAGGMVFYVLLVNIGHLNTLFALVLGLVFALLARHASASLVLEWLLARARDTSGNGDGAGSSGAPPRP